MEESQLLMGIDERPVYPAITDIAAMSHAAAIGNGVKEPREV